MNSTRNIRLLSLVETEFTFNSEKIPKTEEECEKFIKPGFGFRLSPDLEKSTLTVNATVFYGFPEQENETVASLSFSYTIYIERMDEIIKKMDSDKGMTAPTDIMSTIINDVYATARTLISVRLSSTPLKNLYLPFDGAKYILKQMGH